MTRRLRNYFHTLRYLTVRQLVYRLLPARPARECKRSTPREVSFYDAPIFFSPDDVTAIDAGYLVRCLNRGRYFQGSLDWSFMGYGLLWNYHLHYLNWLDGAMGNIDTLFAGYVNEGYGRGSGNAPYPTSLRVVNVIKAVAAGRLGRTTELEKLLLRDCRRLRQSVEYHLLGNHLLENGFALLWVGFFLSCPSTWRIGKTIVLSELRRQVLSDGGHFERSPMYHSSLLWRLLDTVNLLIGSGCSDSGLMAALGRYCRRMTGWLASFPFDSESGHLNDSTGAMAPTREAILNYAKLLDLDMTQTPLKQSGFRVLESENFPIRLFADVGSVGPSYIPGHAHAGTLTFELFHDGKPVLVDTGVSTYEPGGQRAYERSTPAHNTVSVGGLDSSEVWAAFRVARRASTTIHEDNGQKLQASHDGYRSRLGVTHTRTWELNNDCVVVTDNLAGPGVKRFGGTAHFIFHPDVVVRDLGFRQYAIGKLVFSFDGSRRTRLERAQVSEGFNTLKDTLALRVYFRNRLITTISGTDA